MDGPGVYHTSEVSQTEKGKYDIAYKIWKIWYKWTYLQTRNRLTDLENKLMVTNGKGCEEYIGNLGSTYTHWYFKMDNQQV